MEKLTRRGLITGLISFGVAAPAIVKFSSLMPVKVMVDYPMTKILTWGWSYNPAKDGWDVFGWDIFGNKVTEFVPTIDVINMNKEPFFYHEWTVKKSILRKANDQRSGATGGL